MLGDIAVRAEETFLLAAPESDADRSLRGDADRFQNAHRLHGYDRPRAVVGRARAAGPGVEMAAGHDALALLVGAGDLGDRVVGVLVLIVVRRLAVHLEGDVLPLSGEARQAVELL